MPIEEGVPTRAYDTRIAQRKNQRPVGSPTAPTTEDSSPWVNVKRLGAVGDGITDDTAVLQSAITNNTRVFLPNGTYRINGNLTIPPDRVIMGESTRSTIIKQISSSANGLYGLNTRYVTLTDLTLEGPGRAVGTGRGVYFERTGTPASANIVMERVVSKLWGLDGIRIDVPIMSKIDTCRVEQVGGHGYHLDGGGSASFTSTTILSSYAGGIDKIGYYLKSASYSTVIASQAEFAGISFKIEGGQNSTLINCGSESSVVRDTTYNGVDFLIDGGVNHSIIRPWTYKTVAVAVLCQNSASRVGLDGLYTHSPTASATHSILIESGSRATVTNLNSSLPTSYPTAGVTDIGSNGPRIGIGKAAGSTSGITVATGVDSEQIRIDRADTAKSSQTIYSTSDTSDWAVGTRAGSNDLTFRNSFNGLTCLLVRRRDTQANITLLGEGTDYGNGVGVLRIEPATTAPNTNPSSGGVIYSSGDKLYYRGTSGVVDLTGSAAAGNLDSLTDVVITSPSTNQVLKYNGTAWVNATDETGGGSGDVTAHLDDTVDAHDGTAISFVPWGTAPGSGIGTTGQTNLEGAINGVDWYLTALNSAHTTHTGNASIHYALGTTPSTQAFGDSASGGSATTAAKNDHKHAMPALGTAPSTQAFGDAAVGGSATTAAKTDHKHAMPPRPYSRNIDYSIGKLLVVENDVFRWYNKTGRTLTIDKVWASLGVASTSGSVVFDVKKNGTSLWTATGDRPTVAQNANVSTTTAPNTTTISDGEYLRFDVISIGTGSGYAIISVDLSA